MTELPPIQSEDGEESSPGHPVLRVGLYTGALLVIVMLGALVAANRVPGLERYAIERNAVSYTLFVLFMLVPIARFWNSPLQMFGSAMIAWTIFAAAYDISGIVFQNLFDSVRHTPFMALCEGAVVYGVCAVIFWVGSMILLARRHQIAPGRKAATRNIR